MTSPRGLDELGQVVVRRNRGYELWDLFDRRIHVHPYRLPPFVSDQLPERRQARDLFVEAWDPRRPKLIYVHIPFCSSICPYCPFNKQQHDRQTSDLYFAGMLKHLDQISSAVGPSAVRHGMTPSLYFGGGSPSTLQASQLLELVGAARELFLLDADAEVTVELRIADIDDAYVTEIIDSGLINRLSFGVQSFSASLRASVGRLSAPDRVKGIIRSSCQATESVNVDLMYGLPNQTMNDWVSDLHTTLELGVSGCSTYRLNVHSATKFGARARKGNLAPVPASTLENDMWAYAEQLLVDESGWNRSTPANYGMPKRERGIYNTTQLDTGYDILGFGVGSHGQIGPWCTASPKHSTDFDQQVASGNVMLDVHKLNDGFMDARDLLSLTVGANVQTAALRVSTVSAEALDLMIKAGLASESDGVSSLTRDGMYWSRNLFYLAQELHADNLADPHRSAGPRAASRPELPESTVAPKKSAPKLVAIAKQMPSYGA